MTYKPWCPEPDTEAVWIKALREFGEFFSFPTQNFSSVSAGCNRDNREKQVRLVLYARFDVVSIFLTHRSVQLETEGH